MSIGLSEFDATKYVCDPEGHAELLADAFQTRDVTYIKNALGTVVRARGMAQFARDTGIKRQHFLRALGETRSSDAGYASEADLRPEFPHQHRSQAKGCCVETHGTPRTTS